MRVDLELSDEQVQRTVGIYANHTEVENGYPYLYL
jgi:hypothetical protein